MSITDDYEKRLEQASSIENALDKRLWVLGVISDRLMEDGIIPVLVGGAAVEFYTLGGYATKDVDVVLIPEVSIDSAMTQLGFRQEGRFWVRDDIDVVLEAPRGPLAGDADRVLRLSVGGSSISVLGIEDLIVDRLNAYVHWQSSEDGRWVSRLISQQREELDLDYLTARAKEERVEEALRELLENSDANN